MIHSQPAPTGDLTSSIDPAVLAALSADGMAAKIATDLLINASYSPIDGRCSTRCNARDIECFQEGDRAELIHQAVSKVTKACDELLKKLHSEVPLPAADAGSWNAAQRFLYSDLREVLANPPATLALQKAPDGASYTLTGTPSKEMAGESSKSAMYCAALTALANASHGAERVFQIFTGRLAGDLVQLDEPIFINRPAAKMMIPGPETNTVIGFSN